MKKIRGYFIGLYRLAIVLSIAFAAWKIVRHWRAGYAEKAGRAIDASISVAAKKLEKTAIALEEWADSGQGKNLGQGLDEVLTDTKKTLDMASDLIQRTLSHAH